MAWPSQPADGLPLDELLAAALDDLPVLGAQESDGSWRVFFASPDARDRAASLLTVRFCAHGLTLAPVDEADEVLSALSRVGAITSTMSEDGWSAATVRVLAKVETLHD